MQFYLPLSARVPGAKFHPRHFVMLAEFFGRPEWVSDLNETRAGAWAMVVRAPGSYCFGRELAARKAGGAFVFERMTEDERRALQDRDGTLLLDLGWEAFFPRSEVVTGLISGLAEYNIDPARVRILHSNLVARPRFEELWHAETAAPVPQTLEYPTALALCVIFQQQQRDDDRIAARRETAIRSTMNNARSKLFVSFNGEVRPHRLFVVASLHQRKLLQRGHVSLLSHRKGRNESTAEFRNLTLSIMRKYPGGSDIVDAADEILARLPLTLDIEGLSHASLEQIAWETQNPALYDDSHVSLVIDTSLRDEGVLFVTEKILKPIMNHSPFLLLGNAGCTSLLRDYGFETFEPELVQPDAAGDDQAMLSSAIEEITRLSHLSEAELGAMSGALMDRADHNAAHFWTGFPERLRASFEANVLSVLARSHSD